MSKVTYDLHLNTSPFERSLSRAEKKVSAFEALLGSVGGGTRSAGGGLNVLSGSLTRFAGPFALGAAIAGVGTFTKKIFDLGAEMQQTRIAFTTFSGSADKANKLISDLNKFANVTPFDNQAVVKAARTLQAFGISGQDVLPTLKILGDGSAGTGKNSSELGVIYGQIRGANKLMGQDLLQLINAGFNPLQQISKTTGKSIAVLKKEMSKGKISFEDVRQAFIDATSEGGLFNNLMQKQSQSAKGLISTIQGRLQLIMIRLGEKILPVVSKGLNAVLGFMDRMERVKFDGLLAGFNDLWNTTQGFFNTWRDLFMSLFPEGAKNIDFFQTAIDSMAFSFRVATTPLRVLLKGITAMVRIVKTAIDGIAPLGDVIKGVFELDPALIKKGLLGNQKGALKTALTIKKEFDQILFGETKGFVDLFKNAGRQSNAAVDNSLKVDPKSFFANRRSASATSATGKGSRTRVSSVGSSVSSSRKDVNVTINTLKAADKIVLEKMNQNPVKIEEIFRRLLATAAGDALILANQ